MKDFSPKEEFLNKLNFKIATYSNDDDDDVYFPLTRYYLQDTKHSNYLQLLSIIKEFKDL